ncbi:carboxypeptidase regulatory-like domain-containing protein [Nakamurella sp.]|uniref:carboxypeptidase regulatory-like domain-containing protein n=1 Tax=Nakamurella sp. TaxID=1869182 RepID=UPI003B3A94A2
MRVTTGSTLVDLAPGSTADVDVDVVNTGSVIDGITARVIGLDGGHVTTHPPVLALFPDSAGRLTLSLELPTAYPAGRHPLTVEVFSRQDEVAAEYVDLDLLVPTRPDFRLAARPEVVRAHRTGRFVLAVTNAGNVPLTVSLAAADPERVVTPRVMPERLRLEAGRSGEVLVEARGPRMIFGSEVDRPVTVTVTAAPADAAAAQVDDELAAHPDGPAPAGSWPVPPGPPVQASAVSGPAGPGPHAAQHGPELVAPELAEPELPAQSCPLILRQRPWITRGMLTAFILVAIVAVWAAIFLFGLRQVFATDPVTKSAPASFFPTDIALQAATDRQADAAAPAGALPKDGSLPSGLGGTIAGTVVAASDGGPVGRILVEALRPRADGTFDTASSAATQADGSFQVAGLFPGGYLLRFSADGFDPVFYPGTPDQAAATPVTAASAEVTAGIDVTVTGKPATITGSVDPGDILQPVTTTVTARAVAGPRAGQDIASTTTDGANGYTLPDLPAPAEYQLSFAAAGYQPTVISTQVDGGAQRLQPSVLLTAGPGVISGVVSAAGAPVGGITVSTTVGGTTISSGTPTTGDVGRFVLGSLPTPATYVLTISGPGFGSTTEVIDLGPGQQRTDLAVTLASGTGQITGQLVDATGAGVGGATVTVGGMANPPTTSTLTAGTVGAFTVAGLPAGGTLTLTFSKPGFADTTVPVQPGGTPLTVTMSDSLGRISGTVTDPSGAPIAGATVTATDGKRTWPVTSSSASAGSAAGSYVIAGLPVGDYTITAQGPTTLPRTVLVGVTAGGRATADFTLPPDPATVPGAGG